ncbi:MAG: branched-chain amino acid transport system II carrier protein [Clostridium beijerinckii]|jgi:LIVCS family branched-chain amino acid:cation transporter|uniref:Branched-chain amino acid transport system carrier protein n=1 Tax=Clostridium beijerinckii TaxID=1520 RepID=A0A0B5QBA2_CLOBE|nr:branched-chain amino acid transport system II carrier protein [Clostridium beijerinckii]AJG98195.1 branched-chain amino acid transporter [Clostridium beijerinckii]MCI1581222.1 branched-chain amino acid transport system II carrier protein [Clostridium beijerinckii]MCI1585466.1 branched-chain amino acid transport system II carrier protein [Clostridium beijerinckii]MCI1624676.1 branched-chain amino acid transport system II carrier protein [Clostridium beijerinckii]MDG5852312.1 branched-chain a
MKQKLSFQQNLLIGSLLFGLFFGAGNLIFPVQMGQQAGDHAFTATIGFLITGVGLPILGIIASALSRSESLFDMARPISSRYASIFTCLLYLTIGPLFAIPRTATVAFEVGIHPFISDGYLKLGLIIFSLIFFAFTIYFSLKPGQILDWVGKYLTPIFLVLLSILLIATFVNPMGQASQFPAQGNYATQPLFTGLLDGYNTMDALASVAFAIIIISNIQKLGVKNPQSIAIETCKSGLVSVIGMTVIYGSLAYMGATSLGSVNRADNGGSILSMVSNHYFGFTGQILLAFIVGIACIKTAIGLITSCSEMFSEMFPNSVSYKKYAVLFTVFSFIIANFGLSNIIQLSIPVLMFLYPLVITLILLSLLAPFINKQSDVYRWTTGFTVIAAFFDLCKSLPQPLQENLIVKQLVNFAHSYLPGFDYGFGWIIPALYGFFIGLIIWTIRSKKRKSA